ISTFDKMFFNEYKQHRPLCERAMVLYAHWIRFFWINAKFLDGLSNNIGFNFALICQRLERGDNHKITVHFKEMTQLCTCIATTKTFCTQHSVVTWNIGTQLL